MSHLANAGEPKKPAYAREEHLAHEMHNRSWIGEASVDNRKGKRVEVVVIREVSGEDNGVVVIVENPATMQELVKMIEKKIVHRRNIAEFSFLGWLSCKMRILYRTGFEAFLAKSRPPSGTSCDTPISGLILKTIGSFESKLIPQPLPHVLKVIQMLWRVLWL